MTVRTLCLAILNCGDSTGYEIRKQSVEGNFSYFVDASFGAIYPALNKLTDEGLVTVRDEMQAGKPARRVYSITPAGREALLQALAEEPAPDTFRSPFLMLAMFAQMLPRAHVERAIAARRSRLEEKRGRLGECLSCAAGSDAGADWILRYGIAMHEASRRYLEEHGDELLKIAGTQGTTREAAE